MEPLALPAVLRIYFKIVDDVYEYAKAKLNTTINRELINNKIPGLVQKQLLHIRNVKTLWQLDRAVDIDSFYCDSHLIAPSKRRKKSSKKQDRLLVKSTLDFGDCKNIVIQGIAGQGKSIFLRYLCIREFESGNSIPIFIELRRIQPNETLLDHISKYLEILDIPIENDLFKFLSESGKFVFFLDAFDEVGSGITSRIINEIEQLACTSENCRFIITTRPNSTILVSSLFDVWVLDDLRDMEYKDVILKLCDSAEIANIIINKVKASSSCVNELLCTPLLVTLLIICYKSFHKIPDKLSEFYEAIFYVLLQRHDGTKPGFTRLRNCSLNDNEYRQIFNALCYETKRIRSLSFSYEIIYKAVDSAMSITNITEDQDKYLNDIVKITCLILLEGDEYRFIHRSVQDYYSSTFIRSKPDIAVKRFYQACLDNHNFGIWSSELDFLSDIDKYRYNKYFVLPMCQKLMLPHTDDELIKNPPKMTIQIAKNIIGDIDIFWDIYPDGNPLPANEHPRQDGIGSLD